MDRTYKMRPNREEQRTRMMNALKSIHTATTSGSMESEDLERQRKGQAVLGRLIAPMRGISWEPFTLQGIPAAWARPERGHDKRHVILYCHGGGYTSGSLTYARILAAKMANATGYEVLVFDYRLAPEHQYPAPIEDALKIWDYLMHLGYGARDIILAGDSAGGNLALVITMKLRDSGRFLPKRLVLLSPWTDMTASGHSYQDQAESDPILTREYIYGTRSAYAPNGNFESPYLSPLFGTFEGFPPTLIQVGGHEILLSDSTRLHDQLVATGVPCRLEVWPGMWHVFQIMPGKKASQAMDTIARFLLELA